MRSRSRNPVSRVQTGDEIPASEQLPSAPLDRRLRIHLARVHVLRVDDVAQARQGGAELQTLSSQIVNKRP
jgi:hypothetical protein